MTELKYDRWLVALDLTEMDKNLVSWVNYLSVIMKPKAIYFIHVEQDFELPAYMPKNLNPAAEPIDESQRFAVEQLVAENFGNEYAEVQVEVIEGKPFETLLHWTKLKKIDLFVAGRKKSPRGGGILPHKLSRKLPCSILFIPEMEMIGVKKILVPTDFSKHSRLAIKTGVQLSAKITDSTIDCFHLYKVPTGFYKTGKSSEEFAELMKINAEREFLNFIKPNAHKCTFVTSQQTSGSAAEHIYNEVQSQNSDLVIMGSQGQSTGAFLLLGSTTENFVKISDSCLVLVVKMKDENIGFFEAIGKI